MRRKILFLSKMTKWHAAIMFLLCMCLSGVISLVVYAAEELYLEWENEQTGFQVLIEDDANLLVNEEREALLEEMKGITQYGHAIFKTVDENSSSVGGYAERFYQSKFGRDSGTIFLIDMDNRKIWIYSDGEVYKVITKSYADTITDNVYRHASAADYYYCASKAFQQITELLSGHRIAQPMKYISNFLLSLVVGLLINFGIATFLSKAWNAEDKELLSVAKNELRCINRENILVHSESIYSPVSSSSGGSSGGSGGGGGGGGGHSF